MKTHDCTHYYRGYWSDAALAPSSSIRRMDKYRR